MKTLFKVLVLAMILASTFACPPLRQTQRLKGSAMIGDQPIHFDIGLTIPQPPKLRPEYPKYGFYLPGEGSSGYFFGHSAGPNAEMPPMPATREEPAASRHDAPDARPWAT